MKNLLLAVAVIALTSLARATDPATQPSAPTTAPAATGVLEFHVAVDDPQTNAPAMVARLDPPAGQIAQGPAPQPGDTMRWYELDALATQPSGTRIFNGKPYVLVWMTPEKSMVHSAGGPAWSIINAYPITDQQKRAVVGFQFDPGGAALFGALTEHNLRMPLAIILNGRVQSAPRIDSKISDRGIIQGGTAGYTTADVDSLVKSLMAENTAPATRPSPPPGR